MKGVMRFGVKGKLNPRFIGPFEILKCVGDLANRLALPPALSSIHNVFYVSMLKKHIPNPSHVLSYEPPEIRNNLSYEETLIKILDRKVRELRKKTTPFVKVLWRSHAVEEAT